MQGDIHAILLIVLPLAAVLATAILARRTPTDRQITIAFALAGLGTCAAPFSNHHLCREGEPRMQWLILGPCLFLVLLLVKSNAWRRLLGATVFLAMMGLSCHFTSLVHEPGWTGNPSYDGGTKVRLKVLRDTAAIVANDDDKLAKSEFAAGWLRDLPLWPAILDRFGEQMIARRQIRYAWHTRLTGLYRYSSEPLDFWYPGGRFEEVAARIELREKSAK